MRSKFEELNTGRPLAVEESIVSNFDSISDTSVFANYPEGEDACFELLSAYIDGEVTPSERRQVQQWLDNDPKVHRLYIGLLRVQGAMKHIPVTPSVPETADLSKKVFQRLEQEQNRNFFLVGGSVVAAITISFFSSFCLKDYPNILEAGKIPFVSGLKTEKGLMIALNHPVIDLPSGIDSQGKNSHK